MNPVSAPLFCDGPNGRLAYYDLTGAGMGVVFLHGFRSDMEGAKAIALEEFCATRELPFVRFDCFAHGKSDGDFKDFTIGRALESTLYILDHLTDGPQILVGSSMGGWLAFLQALARPEKVSAIIGIAPAPDFTDKIYFDVFNDQERAKLDRTGKAYLASPYGDPYIITKNFIEEARSHFVMDKLGKIKCPLRILQGQQDADVPWQQSLEIAKRWGNSDAKVTLIKDGDHRLSRDEDLARLKQTLEQLLGGMKQGKFLASNPNGPKHDA